MEISFVCPCCGRKFKIDENGAVCYDGAVFDKEPKERLAQVLQERGLEFGVTGGEKDE